MAMADDIGVILVSSEGITVHFQKRDGSVEAGYDKATIENLNDATRVLAAWMDMKHEDIAKECRRVHERDQRQAFLLDCIKGLYQNNE